MENRKAAILVLAVLAALVVTAGGVYAAAGPETTRATSACAGAGYGYEAGPSMAGRCTGYEGMMGGDANYDGGMMGGYGTLDCGQYSMPQFMWQWWNSMATT